MKKVITKFGYVFTVVSIATMAFTSCSKEQEEFTPQSSANVDSQELPEPPTINKELRTNEDTDWLVIRPTIKKSNSAIVGAEVGMRSEPQGTYSEVVVSDSEGNCSFTNVTSGVYVLEVNKTGFFPILDTLIVNKSDSMTYMLEEI